MDVFSDLRTFLTRPHVRPWALSTPILVLLVCLPLLRPLRHPDPRGISDDELGRLATVQALVEKRTLAIDDSVYIPAHQVERRGEKLVAAQPPVLAVLLAGPYAIMHRFGLTFARNPELVAYVLTLLGATIPAAASAGLIYRMGRMFELRRPRRALLALIVVFGSGLISYAVVLNAHAPAAALVLGSAACIAHVTISRRPSATSGWLAIAGMCAALAATIDPAAVVFVILIMCVIPAMRWPIPMRLGGVLLYLLGAAPPIVLHVALTPAVDRSPSRISEQHFTMYRAPSIPVAIDELDEARPAANWWDTLGLNLARLTNAFAGEHGILSHFPIILLGIFGVAAVMHRHWPMTTKALATATLVGGATIIICYTLIARAGAGRMFGPQAFIAFLPLVLFWLGPLLRRRHHPLTWSVAVLLFAFSAGVGLLGATNPTPREGYSRYTVAQALSNLIHRDEMEPPPALAGR